MPAAAEQDAAAWLVNELVVPLGERLTFHTVVQNRWTDNVVHGYERTVVRPWLALALPHRLELALGYDLHEFEEPDGQVEHRAWQRIAWSHPVSRWAFLGHFWLEERFFEGAEDVALRGRFNLGVRRDLTADLDLTLRNEVFLGFNETSRQRRKGLVENQLVLELRKTLSERLRWNVAYLQQHNSGAGPDVTNHSLVTGFTWTAPDLADLFRTRP